MNSEQLPIPKFTPSTAALNHHSQIAIKLEGRMLLLILPLTKGKNNQQWTDMLEELKYHLGGAEKRWKSGMTVCLVTRDNLLDGRQLQTLAEILQQFELKLKLVSTSRRQTAVAAATAGYSVKQELQNNILASEPENVTRSRSEPLYLQTTVRSGAEIKHAGTVIIGGDLNPGGTVIASGDILVWGRLRGIAHAGARGNRESKIMALKMEPTQLRIADLVARAPEKIPAQLEPEVAYITAKGIRLTKAIDFFKQYSFLSEINAWQDIRALDVTR